MLIRKTHTLTRGSAALVRSAFTLMEVLVVVAIIVVLAGVGTMYLLPRLGESKEKAAKAQVKTLTQAAETYELNNGSRPPSLGALTQVQPSGGRKLLDTDAITDPWGHPYKYDSSGQHNEGDKPDIWAETPDGKTIGNWPSGR